MHEPIDVNSLLARTARAENAVLPFAQWKEDLLKKAASYEGAAPLDIDAFGETKRRPKRTLYRIAGAAAGVAAIFILLLNASSLFGTGAGAPSPAAMESRKLAGAGEETAMDSAQSMPEAAAQAPELAAPEAAPPESIAPMMDAGGVNGESGGADDMSPAGQAAPVALDPLLDEAIQAVEETLSARGEALDDQALLYAYRELGGSFTVAPIGGGIEEKITLETACIVVYPDGASYLVKPLDAGGVEVLGILISPNHR